MKNRNLPIYLGAIGLIIFLAAMGWQTVETKHFVSATTQTRSLHVTFAIRPLCGYDLAQALCRLALSDPRLRDYLPDLDQGSVSEQTHDRLAEFKDRLKELLDGPNLAQALAAVRADLMARSNGNRDARAETKSGNPN